MAHDESKSVATNCEPGVYSAGCNIRLHRAMLHVLAIEYAWIVVDYGVNEQRSDLIAVSSTF